MLKHLQRLWLAHVLRRAHIPYNLWHEVTLPIQALAHLDQRQRQSLRILCSRFLHQKTITGAEGLQIDLRKQVYIGSQACLLILNLGLEYYRDWQEIIVYPGSFTIDREEYDSSGVVHKTRRTLAGESWQRGPVILSWSDASPAAIGQHPDCNVIVHEFAHKLDMLNGVANGMPPLHRNMRRQQWTASLSQAYARFSEQLQLGCPSEIDAYAAASPAEFFAVLSEVFFQQPGLLQRLYPQVYEQFVLFYRQDPL